MPIEITIRQTGRAIHTVVRGLGAEHLKPISKLFGTKTRMEGDLMLILGDLRDDLPKHYLAPLGIN
jgi:hypothetical protein